ncbi:unnamed protein product [Camellia sinensis]
MEQKRYGMTPLKKPVDLQRLNELVSIGSEHDGSDVQVHLNVEHHYEADVIPNMSRSPRVKYITYYEDSDSLPGKRTVVWELDKGFDVANIPGVNQFHQILPMDITYNTKHFDTNKELEFVKVLKAMSQAACVLRFYMTFSAKDLADGGNIKTYQAVVLMGVGSKMSVLSFRLKPPEDEQGVIPGEYGFIAHLKKRPTEFRVDKVLQPFDGNKFNFTKVGQEEVLFQFEASDEDNETQFFPWQQKLETRTSDWVTTAWVHLLQSTTFISRCTRNVAYYLAVPFPIEKAPIREITTLNGGVKISELLNYPVRGLVFEGGNTLEDLSNAVSDSCICLQDNIQVGALCLGLVGKVDFTVRHLSSETASFPSTWDFSSSQQCIGGSGVHQCSAYSASASSETTWTMRTTFPEYVVALATIVGSVLFTIFGGVGIACLPLGLIFSFFRRPKAVITRSQYIKAETAWAMTVLGYLAKLVLGVLGLIVSVAWIAHIVIYLLINPPLSPFLNGVFIKLDDVWGLLGTAAFAFFCFYLLLAVIAGAMMLGMRLVFITIHPMKWGATLMNSFLFNVGLILLCSIRYCSLKEAASAAYAQVCAPYHTWAVRTAVYAGMCALPTWEQLLLKLNENGEIVIPL